MSAETSNCKYHPTQAANWHCRACEVNFCNSCVPKNENEYLPKCTLCRRTLESLSIAHIIPPFGESFGHLVKLPFLKAPLTIILLFATIFALLPFGKIGAILFLLCLIPLVEFLFASMEQIAAGDKLDIKVSEFTSLKNKSFLFKFLGAYVLCVLLLTKIFAASITVGYVLSLLIILGLPASLIVLMMEKSMFSMVNPVKIGYIIKSFGKDYFVLYAIILFVAFLTTQSVELMQDEAQLLKRLILNLGVLYSLMCVFLMGGYLVYQHHKELNFTINRQSVFNVTEGIKTDPLAEVNILIQEGRFEEAQTLLLERINQDARDYKANEKLILLYAIQGNISYMNKIAQPYFKGLVEQGKNKQARDFYLKLKKKRVAWIPESTEVVVAICNEMKNKSDFKPALELIDSYFTDSQFPTGWEKLYLLSAQLLIEFANQVPEAKQRLSVILKRGLDQDVMTRAEHYMKAFAS